MPEFRHGERHGFVKRFRLHLNRVRYALRIGEGNAAARDAHRRIITIFVFCSPLERALPAESMGLNYALARHEAQSYRTTGKSNRDDEKIVLRELVPMLAW